MFYVGVHEIPKSHSTFNLMQTYLKFVHKSVFGGNSGKSTAKILSQRHRQNLEAAVNRHRYLDSQVKKQQHRNIDAVPSARAAAAHPNPTVLSSGARRIRGWVGGPSTPAGAMDILKAQSLLGIRLLIYCFRCTRAGVQRVKPHQRGPYGSFLAILPHPSQRVHTPPNSHICKAPSCLLVYSCISMTVFRLQTRDLYDALVVAAGLRVVAEEFPPGSGLYEPSITVVEVGKFLGGGASESTRLGKEGYGRRKGGRQGGREAGSEGGSEKGSEGGS
jgi:hypothetical protein